MSKRSFVVAACVAAAVALVTSNAALAAIASTGFEPDEGYLGNDLMYETHTDVGWTSNWFHNNGGGPGNPTDTSPWSVAANDGSAVAGAQYFRQHRYEDPSNFAGNAGAARDASTIAMSRLFPEQTGQFSVSLQVRMDTAQPQRFYYKNKWDVELVGGMADGSAESGLDGPSLRLNRNGEVRVGAGAGTTIEWWDGRSESSLPTAWNSWVTLQLDIDVAAESFTVTYEGIGLGAYSFANAGLTSLNGIRLRGPASVDGDASQPPNPINWAYGASVDEIVIVPEPTAWALVLLSTGLVAGRRR